MPRRHQSAGANGPACTPSFTDPLLHRVEPEEPAKQPRTAGAEQPGDAENLAAMQRERRRTQPLGREPFELQQRVADRARARADTGLRARVRPSG